LTDFFTDYGVVFALGCAGAAVVYGLLITQRLLAKSPGNDRMQEISGAIQEGASAYLKRQYTIIAGVALIPSASAPIWLASNIGGFAVAMIVIALEWKFRTPAVTLSQPEVS
jgi:K(+)-stimulated pyrophosphate-energized sodium pump